MAKLLAPGIVSTPAAATSSRRLLAFVWLRQTHDRPFPDLHHAGRRRHPHAAPHAQVSPLTTGCPRVAVDHRFDLRGLDLGDADARPRRAWPRGVFSGYEGWSNSRG